MARSSGEVQADIALTRQVIERELDALHRRVPKRWWLAYAWLAGGLVVGVMLSRAPLLVVLSQAVRAAELGAALLGTVAMIERMAPGERVGETRGQRRLGPHNGVER
jgi:hypothetical protein